MKKTDLKCFIPSINVGSLTTMQLDSLETFYDIYYYKLCYTV
jgi:hypothetical protein